MSELLMLVAMIAAGDDVACAVVQEKAYCWGENNDGELGPAAQGSAMNVAVEIPLERVQHISVGDDIVCAVHGEGQVSCWGESSLHRRRESPRPERIPRIRDARSVVAMDRSACVLHKTGHVSCWGGGAPPKPLPAIEQVEMLAARRMLGCALKTDRSVHCWSFETSRIDLIQSQAVSWAQNASAIAINNSSLCAVSPGTEESLLRCGVALDARDTPQTVTRMQGAQQVSVYGAEVCALRNNGRVECLQPAGADQSAPTFVEVPSLTKVRTVSNGEGFACAATEDQEIWCWGRGHRGQLGHGRFQSSQTPVRVLGIQ